MDITPEEIIKYWFSDRIKKQWFSSTPELDREIHDKFSEIWHEASEGKLEVWGDTPEGCLALVILLDQCPLNMFRGKAKSFTTESQAREIAREAIKRGFDKALQTEELSVLYLPFMHSENEADQEDSVKFYQEANLKENLDFAKHHRDLIKEFGRFPHRNAILGRTSTKEELEYLESNRAFKG